MKNEISSRLERDVLIVTVEGKLTNEFPRELRLFVQQKVEDGVKKMILDFKKVSYVNSTGLGEIVVIFTQLSKVGGEVVFLPSPQLASLFQLTKLSRIVRVVTSVEEGLQLLTS